MFDMISRYFNQNRNERKCLSQSSCSLLKYIEFIGLLDYYRLIKMVCDDFSTPILVSCCLFFICLCFKPYCKTILALNVSNESWNYICNEHIAFPTHSTVSYSKCDSTFYYCKRNTEEENLLLIAKYP